LQLILAIEYDFPRLTFAGGSHGLSPYAGFRSAVILAIASANRRRNALIGCGPGLGG
jgi:hypothetical protein